MLGFCIPADGVLAKSHQNLVDNAHIGSKKTVDQSANYDPGDKVGEEHHALGKLLKTLGLDLIKENRQGDGHNQAQDQTPEIDVQGIPNGFGTHAGAEEEILKVLQANEFTAEDAIQQVILGECHPQAGHGNKIEQDHEEQTGNTHQIQCVVFLHFMKERTSLGFTNVSAGRRILLFFCFDQKDPPSFRILSGLTGMQFQQAIMVCCAYHD